jgi:hypothetical protein
VSAVPPGADGDLPEEPGHDRGEERRRVDVEAAWADIVAHWDAEPPAVGSWPAQEDVDPAGGPHGAAAAGDEDLEQWWGQGRAPGRHRLSREDGGPAAGAPGHEPLRGPQDDLDGAEDRYTPPEPPPLARGGWRSWLPWVGVLGAPVFFLVYTLAGLSLPSPVLLLVVVAFVSGFVTLVLRLPASRGDDDDGAVV